MIHKLVYNDIIGNAGTSVLMNKLNGVIDAVNAMEHKDKCIHMTCTQCAAAEPCIGKRCTEKWHTDSVVRGSAPKDKDEEWPKDDDYVWYVSDQGHIYKNIVMESNRKWMNEVKNTFGIFRTKELAEARLGLIKNFISSLPKT